MNETKQEVFEALLKDSRFDLVFWRERYEKADRFDGGYHDVDDLYEDSPKPQETNVDKN